MSSLRNLINSLLNRRGLIKYFRNLDRSEALKLLLRKIYKGLKNPSIFGLYFLRKKISRILPDKIHILLLYRLSMGKSLNLFEPRSFNEKLQWLKLYNHNPNYINLVDKYEVRNFIKNNIGEEYLVPLIGVFDRVEDIDYSVFPNEFVLKPTHTSGDVIICRNKSELNIKETNKILKRWLKRNYYWYQREWPYKNIKPRIICEELLSDGHSEDLIDYKILCFNEKPRCLFLCHDRKSEEGLKVDFYDMDWNSLPFERHYPKSAKKISKPICFNEMIELARTLSKGIPFVRVDFYVINNKPLFGELTFYPGSGIEEFTPESFDYVLGSWIDLSVVEREH